MQCGFYLFKIVSKVTMNSSGLKVWKAIEVSNSIPRTKEVLEKKFFQNSYGKVLDFYVGKF